VKLQQTWPRSQNFVVASVFTLPQSSRIGSPFIQQFSLGERPALCFVTAFIVLIALASHSCADTESETHSDDEGNKSPNNHGFPFILIPA
jgi:hypothetical protein